MNEVFQQYSAHMNASVTPNPGMMGGGLVFLIICGLGLFLGAAWVFKRR